MADAYICDFVRTPIGRYGGALKDVRTDDLAAHPIRVLMERNAGSIGSAGRLIYGCANQAGEDNRNVARMAVLLAGLPPIPGATSTGCAAPASTPSALRPARSVPAKPN